MTNKKKQILAPILIVLAVIAIIGIMMSNKKVAEKKRPEKAIPVVETRTAHPSTMTLVVQSQGLVEPKYQTNLVAQVAGEIVEIAEVFQRGNLIKKGTVIAQIDPFNYQVSLQQAQANLASARANFILERAQGQVAEAEWAKITTSAPSELGLRKPQQEQALASVKAAEAAVKRAEKDLQRTEIIAPFDAVVLTRQVSLGGFANQGSVVASLADVTSAEIRLPVSQKDFVFLQGDGVGSDVILRTQMGNRQHQWRAQVIRNEGVIDEQNRMMYLVAKVAAPYAEEQKSPLYFGSYVTADIQGQTLSNAVTIPRAILRDNQVPLLRDGLLHFAPVTVVRHDGKNTIVRTGLNAGDELIISALEHPVEGMSIKRLSDKTSSMPSPPGTAQ